MNLRDAAQQALEALETKGEHHPRVYRAIEALRAALAQPEQEPVAWIEQMTDLPQGYEPHEIPPDYTGPLFLESQMRAVIEVEREACAKVCEARYMGDNNREDMEARRCAAAIRARGKV